uniref:ATP-dependent DNA ligase n=1 Tax=Schistosoma mansoni TaxID=6183 RepID=A0A5K4F7F1_SCHMA
MVITITSSAISKLQEKYQPIKFHFFDILINRKDISTQISKTYKKLHKTDQILNGYNNDPTLDEKI